MYCGEGDTRFPGTDTFGGAFGAGNESAIGHGPSVTSWDDHSLGKKAVRRKETCNKIIEQPNEKSDLDPPVFHHTVNCDQKSFPWQSFVGLQPDRRSIQTPRFGGIIFIQRLTEPVPYWNLSNSGFASINDPPTQFQVNSLVIPFDVNYAE